MEQPKYKIFNRDAMKYMAIFFMFWGHLAWIGRMRLGDGYDPTALPVWQQVFIPFSQNGFSMPFIRHII